MGFIFESLNDLMRCYLSHDFRKIGKFKESNEQLSAQRTQYIFINKIQTN